MNIYTFKRQFDDKLYSKLLQSSLAFFESFMLFVILEKDSFSKTQLYKEIAPSIVKISKVKNWPGTISCEEKDLYFCRIDESLIEKILKVLSTFDSWGTQDCPEDLSFVRNDGAPWFISISHENDCYFKLTEKEKSKLEKFLNEELRFECEDENPDEKYLV